MKKIIMPILLIILLLANQHNIFAALNPAYDGLKDEDIILRLEEVLQNRILIFNDLHGETKTDLKDIKKKLKMYIVDPLLSSDIETFELMISEGVDYELIRDFQLDSFKILKHESENVHMEVEINWLLEGMQVSRYESITYFMEMEKRGEKWFLKDYFPK